MSEHDASTMPRRGPDPAPAPPAPDLATRVGACERDIAKLVACLEAITANMRQITALLTEDAFTRGFDGGIL